jgi:hypothetical protein
MEQMMQHFKLQPQKEVGQRRRSMPHPSRRTRPFCGDIVREKALPSIFKRGPPNAIVIPSSQTESMSESSICEIRKRHPSENSTIHEQYLNNSKRIHVNSTQTPWYQDQFELPLKQQICNPQQHMQQDKQQQQQEKQARCISVIKVSPRVEQKGLSDYLRTNTVSVLAGDHTIVDGGGGGIGMLAKPPRKHDACTQTEDSSLVTSPSDESFTFGRSIACQTESSSSSEEEPRLIPLVTPPLYGIDPTSGNAVSLVFHFRVPSQGLQPAKIGYESKP